MAAGELPTQMLAALECGACLTTDELVAVLNCERHQVSRAIARLALRGWAERVEIGCFRLTPAGVEARERGEVVKRGPYRPDTAPARKPVPDTLRQRAWTAIRISGTFTLGDIVVVASRDTDIDPTNNISRFVRFLVACGYALQMPKRTKSVARGSHGFKRYRLVKDTGPIAPTVRVKGMAIYDHNTGEALPCKAQP